jgi:hypothetical protein
VTAIVIANFFIFSAPFLKWLCILAVKYAKNIPHAFPST